MIRPLVFHTGLDKANTELDSGKEIVEVELSAVAEYLNQGRGVGNHLQDAL